MKSLFLSLALVFSSSEAWAGMEDIRESSTQNLICAQNYYFTTQSGISCVSKASIERDKLQVEVLKLQLQELKDKAAEKALAQSRSEEAEKAKALKKLSPKERKQLGLSK